jgi:hypothetical protein
MTHQAQREQGSRAAAIGLVIGTAMGLGACAQIIGLEPWPPGEGSSSAMTGAGGAPSTTSSTASGAGGHGGAPATSSSSSSSATSSSSSSSATSSSSSSSSGGGTALCDPCQNDNECMSGCCKFNICVKNTNGCTLVPLCSDGCKEGSESDVDCGGMLCPKCISGQRCKIDADCDSGMCTFIVSDYFCN